MATNVQEDPNTSTNKRPMRDSDSPSPNANKLPRLEGSDKEGPAEKYKFPDVPEGWVCRYCTATSTVCETIRQDDGKLSAPCRPCLANFQTCAPPDYKTPTPSPPGSATTSWYGFTSASEREDSTPGPASPDPTTTFLAAGTPNNPSQHDTDPASSCHSKPPSTHGSPSS